jgi:hypothetical protein
MKLPAGFATLRIPGASLGLFFAVGSGGAAGTGSNRNAFDGKLSFQTSREDCGAAGALGDEVICAETAGGTGTTADDPVAAGNS